MEAVEQANPVGDQVGPVRGEQGQVCDRVRSHLDGGEVPSQTGGVGDDVGVAGVGLGLAAVGAGHAVDRPAGHVDDPLAVRCEQNKQQSGGGAGDVHGPVHAVGQAEDFIEACQEISLVVADLLVPHRCSGAVDGDPPVVGLAGVDTDP